MGNAMFYHLTRSPAERLLPALISRARGQGWRIELRGSDAARMQALDAQLWVGDGFVPHGLAGGPHDARQPVLLTVAGQAAGNGANCLMTLDGADVSADEMPALHRACIIFDGGHTPAVNRARDQWRALTTAGIAAEYWSEESGRWERKR
ncbi:DNA polymerase III subunit chi [Paracoccus sp. (in: a-proteobacteria)]|uniref:DNA polymerase III subunit chi n=1 Tax=Paracoccus sp. TaxID=267 RepID=UPI0026E033E7|nr:DNA polymerase III subunit chi [Paracoccus sp. (in: a-proteobacteria)]MDO5648647.1 DNA polymerase III subunit chi [Paracoccus sp. (in: a-proteobacteria)]